MFDLYCAVNFVHTKRGFVAAWASLHEPKIICIEHFQHALL